MTSSRGPLDPGKVRRIIRLRENQNKTWREIGLSMGLSHQAPFLRYQKWRQWVHDNKGK